MLRKRCAALAAEIVVMVETKCAHLVDGIDNNHDGIVTCRLWQLDNEVYAESVTVRATADDLVEI